MKKWMLLFGSGLLIMLLFQHCKKDKTHCPDDWQKATIIGADLRLCACCGGWFIDLGQDTVRTFGFPDGFETDALIMANLPMEVCLTYQDLTGTCSDFEQLVRIDRIVRR